MCVQTLVSCNEQNTSASVIETDDGVGTEDQSQLMTSLPHQDHLCNVGHCSQLHVSSMHHELLKKNEQLKFLRQMVKEVRTVCLFLTGILIKQCVKMVISNYCLS